MSAPSFPGAEDDWSISPFVRRSLAQIELPRAALVLDIPCGYGRHAIWLAKQGYQVVAADLDRERVVATQLALVAQTDTAPARCLLADCEAELPFREAVFDMTIIVHYYSADILGMARRTLRPNGYLVFETFGAQGQNWRSLPQAGVIPRILEQGFEVIHLVERLVGPSSNHAVVRAMAKKIDGKSGGVLY